MSAFSIFKAPPRHWLAPVDQTVFLPLSALIIDGSEKQVHSTQTSAQVPDYTIVYTENTTIDEVLKYLFYCMYITYRVCRVWTILIVFC